MPRMPRQPAASGFYHITMRGNAKVTIFECDAHRWHFLKLLKRYAAECGFVVIAWCLMSNHVHLVLDANDVDLSATLQRLATAYVVYFNGMEDRVGHLFQSPFRSKPIDYEEQLVNTVRYVHNNPERASICAASEYPWSSYQEYANSPHIIDPNPAVGLAGSVQELLCGNIDYDCVVKDRSRTMYVSDDQARKIIERGCGLDLRGASFKLSKAQRNRAICFAARRDLSPKQIARILGIGQSTVYRVVAQTERAQLSQLTPLAK